jgi:hypothetical protein
MDVLHYRSNHLVAPHVNVTGVVSIIVDVMVKLPTEELTLQVPSFVDVGVTMTYVVAVTKASVNSYVAAPDANVPLPDLALVGCT